MQRSPSVPATVPLCFVPTWPKLPTTFWRCSSPIWDRVAPPALGMESPVGPWLPLGWRWGTPLGPLSVLPPPPSQPHLQPPASSRMGLLPIHARPPRDPVPCVPWHSSACTTPSPGPSRANRATGTHLWCLPCSLQPPPEADRFLAPLSVQR